MDNIRMFLWLSFAAMLWLNFVAWTRYFAEPPVAPPAQTINADPAGRHR
jgi:hypothetical protein